MLGSSPWWRSVESPEASEANSFEETSNRAAASIVSKCIITLTHLDVFSRCINASGNSFCSETVCQFGSHFLKVAVRLSLGV